MPGSPAPRICSGCAGPLHRPERAGGVEPGVVPGLERGGPVDAPGVGVPLRPAPRPVDVAALHRVVDGELVLALRAHRLVLADYRPAGAAVQVAGQRGGQARPQGVAVAALQEGVVELVGADHRARRAGDRMRLEAGAGPVPGLTRPGRGCVPSR